MICKLKVLSYFHKSLYMIIYIFMSLSVRKADHIYIYATIEEISSERFIFPSAQHWN